MFRYCLPALALLAVAGCVTPRTELTPLNYVKVGSDGKLYKVLGPGKDVVTCQDYWERVTLWDFALVWPDGMTAEDAQAVCRSNEQMALENPTARPWEPILRKANVNDVVLRNEANRSVGERIDIKVK